MPEHTGKVIFGQWMVDRKFLRKRWQSHDLMFFLGEIMKTRPEERLTQDKGSMVTVRTEKDMCKNFF